MERVIYKKSLTAKMVMAGADAISVYKILKDACSSREDVSNRLSFDKETIKYGKNKIGVIRIARKTLSLYLAIDPKTLEGTNIKYEDVSETKAYVDYPTRIVLNTKKSIKNALSLLNKSFNKYKIKEKELEEIDYNNVFYYREFDELLRQGYIKKYVYRKIDNKKVLVEEKIPSRNVHFTVKLLYCAMNEADNLFIVTNYNNWNFKNAVKMNKVSDNLFEANMTFPEGTNLEFKICRSESFNDVEKGIWKEEIVNHHYVIGNEDLEIEDLIHNFRLK